LATTDDRPDQLLALERRCQDLGLPVTIQRRAILAVLVARRDHPTADRVAADLARRMPGISRATVYRTLETLVAHGLLLRASHPGAAARYDLNLDRHHHLVCDACGDITDFEEPALNNLPLPDFAVQGFRIRDFSIHVRGLCKRCAKPKRAPRKNSF
jgi:Fur family peroxide stress response transcriptional regulator